MRTAVLFAAMALAAFVTAGPVSAQGMDKKGMNHEHMHHGEMKAPMGNKEAEAMGVINSVDAASGKVNVTHEPVEALGWPKMTMDLPVTKPVDLSTVRPGDHVKMMLKQGRDKQYRITGIEKHM